MCGIAGISGTPDALACVHRLTGALAHRGPDGEGYYAGESIALGHTRLAILDLTKAGLQPMRSRDRRWVLALNGEIFNYRELRAQLGGEFATATDTEALLEACAAWGIETALKRAIGMFAFALWDRRNRVLTLARDRCGEKPLVYFWDGSVFAFASELKALRSLHGSHLDAAAVDAYLALGYVPAPLSIFRGCRKLPAGHLLRFRNGGIEVRRWWFPEQAAAPIRRSRGAKVEEARALIADAVRLRLRSDVPVALSLSGGVDSSVIAAECARQGASPDAFTMAFESARSEEADRARSVATQLGLKHRVIEAGAETAASQLERAAAHYDEPFADSSALPSLALARALGGSYKVILNGDGGDESFGGYPHYQYIGIKQWIKRAAAAAGLKDGSGRMGVYLQSKALFREKERRQLLRENAVEAAFSSLLDSDGFLQGAPRNALRRALWSDRHLHLPNDLTYKMDIALAAFGMEGRAPLLDHRIFEWAQGLDPGDLVRGRQKKVLLREAYRADLPSPVLDQPKRGFGAPVAAWLAGPLEGIRRESLPCPLFDPEQQQRASGQRLWTLLAFARWAKTWGARW